MPRWRIEAGLVGDAGADGFGHGVVDGEDGVFGDVGAGLGDLAVLVGDGGAFDVFEFYDGEGFHDVLDGVARCAEHLAGGCGLSLSHSSWESMAKALWGTVKY